MYNIRMSHITEVNTIYNTENTYMVKLDPLVESIKLKINAFKDSDETAFIIKDSLTKLQRKSIYEYTETEKLFSSSIMVGNTLNKNIVISKTLLEKGTNMDPYTIELFSKYSMVPIPVPLPEYMDYYMDMFEPYYGTRQFFNIFETEFKKHRNVSAYTLFINNLMGTIVNDIKNLENTKEFMKKKFDEHVPHLNFTNTDLSFMKKKGTVYVENNNSKQFLSIDIKAANYNILKDYDQGIVLGFDTWTDLIKSYTTDEFIIKSKHFREVVFGKVGTTPKALNLCPYYLSNVLNILYTQYDYKETDIVSVNCDEIVLKYRGEIPENILKTYPGFYNVEVYDLHKFQNKPFYYKQIKYPIVKTTFKCVPKKFIAQAIKKFEKKGIEENDLKFLDEGMVAQYSKPCF